MNRAFCNCTKIRFHLLTLGCDIHPISPRPNGTSFPTWKRSGLLPQIHDHLRELVRLESGKKPKPTAAILDSQTIKRSESSGERGYDAGKKINGRKRHLLVDMMGLILMVMVLPANVQDRKDRNLHPYLYRPQTSQNRMSRLAANHRKATNSASSECGAKRGRFEAPPHSLLPVFQNVANVASQECAEVGNSSGYA